MQYLVQHLQRQSAERYSEKVALVQGDMHFSYGQVESITNRLANVLHSLGTRRMDRVGVFLDHSLNQVLSFWGVVKTGGVYVPVNSQLLAPQADHIARDCRITGLIVDQHRLELLKAAIPDWAFLKHVIVLGEPPEWLSGLPIKVFELQKILMDDLDATPLPDQCIGSDLACLLYTSGSTGHPKGVMITHDNLIVGARIVTSYLQNQHEDRLLGVLPLSFDYGLNQVICSALLGMTYVMTSFRFPGELVQLLLEERITGFAGIPTIWLLLLQRGSAVFSRKFPHLRYITNSGGFLPPTAVEKLKSVFPATQIFLMYGLTEAFRSTYLPPELIDSRPTSMGKAIPGCEILVVDKGGKLCSPDEVGELVHRGPTVSLGYWGNPEKTEKVFRPNPFLPKGVTGSERLVYSGDLVKMDGEGYLYFVGRDDHMIKCYGHRISPAEIEDVLYASGKVKLAAAIGIPDPVRGQCIKIFIVPQNDESITEEEILTYCAEKLPPHMIPRYVDIRMELPKTPTGKIDIPSLRSEEM